MTVRDSHLAKQSYFVGSKNGSMKKVYGLLAALLLFSSAIAQISITNLLTQSQSTPLGIDDPIPAFTWQMNVPANQRGFNQQAYQIVVKDAKETVVWDS